MCLNFVRLVTFFLLLFTINCQKNDSSEQEKKTSQTYKYIFPGDNNCSTGLQTFNSLTAYCTGLTDNTKNSNCAYLVRKETFKKECPGKTWPHNDANYVNSNSYVTNTYNNSGVSNNTFPITYLFFEWNCNTGIQKFNTKNEYCAGLKNDSLNNNCADSQREIQYRINCNGESFFYEYFGYSCSTGYRGFKTQKELCQGLLNEGLNNNCARETRQFVYDSTCRY